MSSLPPAVLGAGAGIGCLLVLLGVRGRRVLGKDNAPHRPGRHPGQYVARIACGLGAAILVALATRWPIASVAAAFVGFAMPDVRAASGRHQREVARVEAIAAWTEQLRDTLSAANGLEHAITAAARLAPAPIELPVARLAARLQYEPLSRSLREFAMEVDHPLADFVVAALVMAREREARELGPLLGHLAECARDDARMRSRVWVSRARTRTAVRIIGGVVVVSVAALYVINAEYLAAYGTIGGQMVLLLVIVLFGAALAAMDRLGRIAVPERFIARRSGADR